MYRQISVITAYDWHDHFKSDTCIPVRSCKHLRPYTAGSFLMNQRLDHLTFNIKLNQHETYAPHSFTNFFQQLWSHRVYHADLSYNKHTVLDYTMRNYLIKMLCFYLTLSLFFNAFFWQICSYIRRPVHLVSFPNLISKKKFILVWLWYTSDSYVNPLTRAVRRWTTRDKTC